MHRFSEMPVVDLARFQIYREIDPLRSVLRKAERATPLRNLEKLTVLRGGKHVFRDQKPTQYHVSQKEADAAVASLRAYMHTLLPERAHFFSQYQVEDVAFRVVGTGSVGLRDYVLLMFGGAVSDPLFIQIKEEPGSAYASYLPHSPGGRASGTACGRRWTRHANAVRHLPGMDLHRGTAITWSASCATTRRASRKTTSKATGWWSTRRCAANCSPRATPARAIPAPSQDTWATTTSSTRPWPPSVSPTPTRR